MTKIGKRILIAGVAFVFLLAVVVVALLVSFGFHSWKVAQREGNRAAAAQNLKMIAAVEIQYYNTHNRSFGTFDQMIADGLLDKRFSGAAPIVDGYVFTLKMTLRTPSQPSSFTLNADPETTNTGTNHFYFDSWDGRVRVNEVRPADSSDPPFVD